MKDDGAYWDMFNAGETFREVIYGLAYAILSNPSAESSDLSVLRRTSLRHEEEKSLRLERADQSVTSG